MPAKKPTNGVKNTDIPTKFYRGDRHPKASSVGELKKILEELPDDLPLGYDDDEYIEITVSNNGPSSPTRPFVIFDLIDE